MKEQKSKPGNLQLKENYHRDEVLPAALPQTEESIDLSENESYG